LSSSHCAKVAVVDHHTLFAECLGVVLAMRQYSVHAVPPPQPHDTPAELLAQLVALRADVVVINIDLGHPFDDPAFVGILARHGTPVVVLTDRVDPSLHGDWLAVGARGVLTKSAGLSTLMSAIRRVSQGRAILSIDERERLIALAREKRRELSDLRARLASLSSQEGDVLRHLMAGRTVKEIATHRVVSETTVRTQVKAILHKLEATSQIAAVAGAYRAGWGPDHTSIAS
jgi:two-component system nitrate/nitrite response regulator NarL